LTATDILDKASRDASQAGINRLCVCRRAFEILDKAHAVVFPLLLHQRLASQTIQSSPLFRILAICAVEDGGASFAAPAGLSPVYAGACWGIGVVAMAAANFQVERAAVRLADQPTALNNAMLCRHREHFAKNSARAGSSTSVPVRMLFFCRPDQCSLTNSYVDDNSSLIIE
jgi:hypothetical protein